MPFVARIGETIQTLSEADFEWKIENFRSLSEEKDDYYDSPVFYFADSQWFFRLYSYESYESDVSPQFVHLAICGKDCKRNVSCTLGIQYPDGKKIKREVQRLPEEDDFHIYLGSRRSLNSRLGPDSVLTLSCHLKCTELDVTKVSLSNRIFNLSRNMKTVLDDGRQSDFTLMLGNREWFVHRAILESRSEYFANMFRHDWVENTEGEVTFADIDEGAMASVLSFIYTGDVKNMSFKNVCEIYTAAHKFLLTDLKELCVEYIKGNMCIEILCKVFITAERYDERDLHESAVEYIIREADQIFDSDEWQQLKRDHLSIVADILEETTKRGRKKRRIE